MKLFFNEVRPLHYGRGDGSVVEVTVGGRGDGVS